MSLPKESRAAMQTGISAGAAWFALQDLRRNADNLKEGELREAWVEAFSVMQVALDMAPWWSTGGRLASERLDSAAEAAEMFRVPAAEHS